MHIAPNTRVLPAGTTYHIKLAIAGGHDDKIDSVVWIRAGSVRFNIRDCVGAWVPHTWGPLLGGTCTGVCEGGTGLLPEVYFISVAAANGGCSQDRACVQLHCRVPAACNLQSDHVQHLWQSGGCRGIPVLRLPVAPT